MQKNKIFLEVIKNRKIILPLFLIISSFFLGFFVKEIYNNYFKRNTNLVNIKKSSNKISLEDVLNNKNTADIIVLLYIKDKCSYCMKAEKLLKSKNIKYDLINLTSNHNLHLQLIKQTQQITVPYVFYNNKFIGGYSELNSLLTKPDH